MLEGYLQPYVKFYCRCGDSPSILLISNSFACARGGRLITPPLCVHLLLSASMGSLRCLAAASLLVLLRRASAPLAFHGAEGFGWNSVGGWTGSVYHVTNLAEVSISASLVASNKKNQKKKKGMRAEAAGIRKLLGHEFVARCSLGRESNSSIRCGRYYQHHRPHRRVQEHLCNRTDGWRHQSLPEPSSSITRRRNPKVKGVNDFQNNIP
ncbi:hypothetical protein GGS21DRAFT_223684 [Xylaria nigripes]|nr:hypothetical protein GGS21DRAFT_223684 [Xylaria nigripes]